MLLEALAVTETVAETVVPFAGEVMETVGGATLPVVAKVISPLTALELLASVDRTRKW
jgi:hypothetical protein